MPQVCGRGLGRAAYPHGGVAAAGDEDVQRRVERAAVHARQVAVVVPHHLVHFEVPALDHLVVADGEQVRVAVAHAQATHRVDVARQRELERAAGQVPNLRAPNELGGGALCKRQAAKEGRAHTLRYRTLIILSADPVANHSLVGSTAMLRTQPKWPEMTWPPQAARHPDAHTARAVRTPSEKHRAAT